MPIANWQAAQQACIYYHNNDSHFGYMSSYTEDQLDYIDQVFDRSKKLINARIWDEIKLHRLELWRSCFTNYGAELAGAYLLDNLCFRSRDQFFSLLDTLLLDFSSQNSPGTQGSLLTLLQSRPNLGTESSVRVAPVIDLAAPPTKSGPYVLRLAQRRYDIRSHWLCWPAQIHEVEELSELIFIDDFCGTGNQFVEFAQSIGLPQLIQSNKSLSVTYLVAVAHQDGIDHIKEKFPTVNIKWAEKLGTNNSVLHDDCFARYQIANFQKLILEQYAYVTDKVGLPKGKLGKGFGKLGLAYGFAHATPNNTLPIFWYETDNWTPLLDR